MTKGMKLDAADLNGDKAKKAYLDERIPVLRLPMLI